MADSIGIGFGWRWTARQSRSGPVRRPATGSTGTAIRVRCPDRHRVVDFLRRDKALFLRFAATRAERYVFHLSINPLAFGQPELRPGFLGHAAQEASAIAV